MEEIIEIKNASIPHNVSCVMEGLEKAGFEAYLVGGCVRDLIRGYIPKDWDITTNARPEQIQALFEDSYYTNEFGTVGVVSSDVASPELKVIEVTPYRTEHGYSDARRPDRVEFSDRLEEDLGRRDFTMNAIAYSPSKGHIVDLFHGVKDIKDKRITAVGDPNERFSEDALRMLRALRLHAELGFIISHETYEAIPRNAHLLSKISKERIRDEFVRIIMSDNPMEAMLHAKQLGLLGYMVPALEKTIGVEQNRSHIYSVFEHLLRSLQHAAEKKFSLEVRLAALFHDISKPETKRFDKITKEVTFYGHEVLGAQVANQVLQELKFSHETVQKVTKLVRWHMFFSDPDKITISAVRRMIRNVGEELIWELVNLRICDRIGSGKPKERPLRLRKYQAMIEEALRDPISVGMLEMDGNLLIRELHMKPGPVIGHILHALLDEVLDEPKKNKRDYLIKRAEELLKLPPEELKKLGEKGRVSKDIAEQNDIKEIRSKYYQV